MAVQQDLSGWLSSLWLGDNDVSKFRKLVKDAAEEKQNEQALLDAVSRIDNVDILHDRKRTALHVAAVQGFGQLARLLIDRGANIEAIDEGFWTPLHLASGYGNSELVALLLERGANVNHKDNDSWTPVHQAISQGHLTIVRQLVKAGADLTIRTTDDHRDAFDRADSKLSVGQLQGFCDILAAEDITAPTAFQNIVDLAKLNEQAEESMRQELQKARILQETPVLRRSESEKRIAMERVAAERDSIDKPRVRYRMQKQPVNAQAAWDFQTTSLDQETRQRKQKHMSVKEHSEVKVRMLTTAEVASAKRTRFQYAPLRQRSPATPIRLLTFDDEVAADDQLIVRLENASSLNQSYIAVSYVWGEPTFSHKILCEHGTSCLGVTERLHRILRLLKLRGQQAFWIDAICINQLDVIERNFQVRQMADIYRNAESVHVFLDTPSLAPVVCASSPWWSRRWVIQEVLSAARVYVHSNELERSSVLTLDQVADHCLDLYRAPLEELPPSVRAALAKMQELAHMRKGLRTISSIFTHLLHFHDTECQDPRDRLYSFFGISHGDLVTITTQAEAQGPFDKAKIKCAIDYDQPVAEVYLQFAIAALRSAQAMDLLHCAGAFQPSAIAVSTSTGQTWPSWVPDWRAARRYHPLMRSAHFVFAFPVLGKTKIQIDESARTITLPGFRVGVVVSSEGRAPDMRQLRPEFYVNYVREGKIDMIMDRSVVFVDMPGKGVKCAYAPPVVEEGDIVVTFAGAQTPFILRVAGPSSFILVCDCWLEPAMAYRGGDLPKIGKVERFTLV